jgi:hypothetical protein
MHSPFGTSGLMVITPFPGRIARNVTSRPDRLTRASTSRHAPLAERKYRLSEGMRSTADSPTWTVVFCSKASVTGLGALRTSLEFEHPMMTARMQAIFLISGTMMVLAEVDVNIE